MKKILTISAFILLTMLVMFVFTKKEEVGASLIDEAPIEITSKYTKDKETLKMVSTNNHKIEIGGELEFEPKLKIQKWNGETKLDVKLKESEVGTPDITYDKEKII